MTLSPDNGHAVAPNSTSGASAKGASRAAGTARRRSTSHLKAVPETLALREQIRDEAERFVRDIDRTRPFTKAELESWGRQVLDRLEQPEKYLGFTMVMLGNFYWKKSLLAIPFERRLLLLPHCLKHAEGCPADYDEFGLDCETCGACSIADYKVRAEQLGYKVLVAEGSPIVLKIIVSGHVDGILGVACLNVLEKAIDKVLLAGVPSFAVPLHSSDCKNTTLDESWVWECLDKYEPLDEPRPHSYVPLMRAANQLFDEQFDELVPRMRTSGQAEQDMASPLAATEAIAYDWLRHGGKRLRPFITLAAYDACTGGAGLGGDSDGSELELPTAVRRVAVAIEAFHKASLVHDDIEDDDPYRYGQETLHRRYDLATAINVGDHLIGLGYRLVSLGRDELGSDVVGDVVDRLALAHLKLCDGQGAEMRWQADALTELKPLDVLKIYALKTAPAFEAALYAGLRMAQAMESREELVTAFCRQLGVGFQILNDLKDWQGDDHNKLVSGRDAAAMRPTLLLSLALDGADDSCRAEIASLLNEEEVFRMGALRRLFEQRGAFEKARALVEKARARAETLADDVEPDELRQLLYFLVDTVLAEEQPEAAPSATVLAPLPVVSASSG